MFRKLRTVIYHVTDLQKAKEWYKLVTGISPYFDESFYVGFDINGCELGLDPSTEEVKGGTQSVAYWLVDNIEESIQKFTINDAKIISPVTSVGEGIKVATIQDPFGNCIGLIEEAIQQ
ncbi:MAG: VOC family protein [Ginsengibacter sp.]